MKLKEKKLLQDKVLECLALCGYEKNRRVENISGESSISQLNQIISDLNNLKEILDFGVLPPSQKRYLVSFANAFRVWGWDMVKPSDLFLLLKEINNRYRDL